MHAYIHEHYPSTHKLHGSPVEGSTSPKMSQAWFQLVQVSNILYIHMDVAWD